MGVDVHRFVSFRRCGQPLDATVAGSGAREEYSNSADQRPQSANEGP